MSEISEKLPSEIDPRLKTCLEKELEQDEQIVWAVQPEAYASSTMKMVLLTLGVILLAGCLLGMGAAWGLQKGTMSIYTMTGIGSVMGLMLLFSPWLLEASRKNTLYVISNRRAMVIEGMGASNIRSFYPADLKEVKRTSAGKGIGNLILGYEVRDYGDEADSAVPVGFLHIADVEAAAKLLENLQQQADRSQ